MNIIEAGHRVIIKRAMRSAGIIRPPESLDELDEWARHHPRYMTPIVEQWLRDSAEAWGRYTGSQDPADEAEHVRKAEQAESVLSSLGISCAWPGLYPYFQRDGKQYRMDELRDVMEAAAED